MDLGFNLAQSNRDLKDPTSRQIFGDTSGLLCKNDPILRLNDPDDSKTTRRLLKEKSKLTFVDA